ncbi:Hypothetical predicted protein [Lynx pardinus]|uniref:Uncharacterized protein n=1 Tax=Lynx pardinus TaxID=191816 RepID=A0A485MUB7_LYNPA|nr:Hypothetical predicted protein [Lynx pardinus]
MRLGRDLLYKKNLLVKLRRPERRDLGEVLAPQSGCGHAAQQWAVIGPGRCNRSLCVTTPPADRSLEPVCAGRREDTAPPAVGDGRTDLLPYPQQPPHPAPGACPSHILNWLSRSSSSVASFMS